MSNRFSGLGIATLCMFLAASVVIGVVEDRRQLKLIDSLQVRLRERDSVRIVQSDLIRGDEIGPRRAEDYTLAPDSSGGISWMPIAKSGAGKIDSLRSLDSLRLLDSLAEEEGKDEPPFRWIGPATVDIRGEGGARYWSDPKPSPTPQPVYIVSNPVQKKRKGTKK